MAEAVDYIEGLRRRERQGWERARMIAEIVCKVMTGEGLDMELPWDKENAGKGEEESEEEKAEKLDRLRDKAKEMEQMMRVKMAMEQMK